VRRAEAMAGDPWHGYYGLLQKGRAPDWIRIIHSRNGKLRVAGLDSSLTTNSPGGVVQAPV